MGYSRLSSRITKSSNHFGGVRNHKLEIITPHIVLTKPVEKINVKKNKKETD